MKSVRFKIIAIVLVVILILGGFIFLLIKNPANGTVKNDAKTSPKSVVALSSSLAEIWILAGGNLLATTSDTLDRNFVGITEDVQVVGSVKDPSLEKILALQPDYVILNNTISGHAALEEPLKNAEIEYYSAEIETFDDYLNTLNTFCEKTCNMTNYEKNGTAVQTQIQSAINGYTVPNPAPTYLVMRVHSSGYDIMKQDNVVCNILDTLGLKNIAENGNTSLKDLSLEAIVEKNPSYIFITTMGDEEAAKETLNQLFMLQPAWQTLSAVQQNHVNILEKELFHYKPNAKWGEAYEEIIRLIQA